MIRETFRTKDDLNSVSDSGHSGESYLCKSSDYVKR